MTWWLADRDFSTNVEHSHKVEQHSMFTTLRRCIGVRMATRVLETVATNVCGVWSLVSMCVVEVFPDTRVSYAVCLSSQMVVSNCRSLPRLSALFGYRGRGVVPLSLRD